MKPQDIVFVIVLIILLFFRREKVLVIAGLLCLLLSIPLFATQIFFTAQRLTYYAAGFFFISVILSILKLRKEK